VSYNDSAVKVYNALERFENKPIFFHFEKTLKPMYYNVGVAVVHSEVVRLSPGKVKGCSAVF
jgi:hypothetical protein